MVDVIVLSAPGCHLCHDAVRSLGEMAAEFELSVREIGMDSPEGMDLIRLHRPAMPPAVIVNGRLFSIGRLPRKKLRKRLLQDAA